jgi:hypothetical protein
MRFNLNSAVERCEVVQSLEQKRFGKIEAIPRVVCRDFFQSVNAQRIVQDRASQLPILGSKVRLFFSTLKIQIVPEFSDLNLSWLNWRFYQPLKGV